MHFFTSDVSKVQHDHSYTLRPSLVQAQPLVTTTVSNVSNCYSARVVDTDTVDTIKLGLRVTSEVRSRVAEETVKQSAVVFSTSSLDYAVVKF